MFDCMKDEIAMSPCEGFEPLHGDIAIFTL